ncbi:MAG: 7-carboxy-7-deazaguanine synthase QueE [Thermoguttaceae bacterium]|jgi:7-carboxy-7-deazaguanine synthase
MRIAEIFRSLQGEGRLTGMESIFIRTSGCNLRCDFCDTPYASWEPEGPDCSVDEILSRAAALETPAGVRHVVITGGEPMLFAELPQLCQLLRQRGKHITIETAGTCYLSLCCDLMSISPKLSNSTPDVERSGPWRARHESTRRAPEVVGRLTAEYDYQLKFVIDTPADCAEVDLFLAGFPAIVRDRVLLMPQGTDRAVLTEKARWLEPYCVRHGFQFCPRRQIEWFGLRRGT